MQQHYIVALGASAGGLEAIQEFFDHMPRTENLSFVIIQHLSPDFKSLLVELVGRHTHMKVVEAADEQPVQKNCIYVIPNNKFISIKRNKLVLAVKQHDSAPNNAIDIFFSSLAEEKKDRAIAVVLSGTGSDGTKGIAKIKELGGMTLVQEPNTARFDGMPNSAINSGNADVITTPAKMPDAILSLIHEPSASTLNKVELDEELLNQIFELIAKEAGQDFHYYKTPTILRRISRRVVMGNFKDADAYVTHLQKDPEEVKSLAKDFLIGVTRFFRDAEAFVTLQEKVLPGMLAAKEDGGLVKVWIPACSTGEEAYSVAIAVEEAILRSDKRIDVKIFATDIDAANLEVASAGVYPATIEKDVDHELLEKYFLFRNNTYSISPRIRKRIVFAKHDIIKDPPFIKNDLVCCRNMLIYMNPVLQERVFSILHFAVNTGGYLFLGPSENPTFERTTVQQISSKWKMYRKTAESKPRPYLSDGFRVLPSLQNEQLKIKRIKEGETRGQQDLWDDVKATVTTDLGFLAVYIDRSFEIRETIGNYELLLSLPKKNLSLNFVRMLPQDLSITLNKEIRKAWKTGQKVKIEGLAFVRSSETQLLNVIINPHVPSSEELTLVVISKGGTQTGSNGQQHMVQQAVNGQDHDYIMNLESELADVKNSLQMAVEDLETTNEELQSSNEELLSSNEELQSSNEELQSLNEELYTLNTEHQLKIRELVELNDDLNNYFRSTDIAQIFLDNNLNIRKFNPASASMINFIESDLGRPISHISNNIRYETLLEDIRQVQRTHEVVEKEVELNEGRHLLMRIMPYVTRDGRYEGLIITFVDITTITDLNNIVRGVFNASVSGVFAFRAVRDNRGKISDFTVIAANNMARRLFELEEKKLEGEGMKALLPQLSVSELMDQYISVVENDKSVTRDVYLEDRDRWFELTAVKMHEGFVGTFTDITDKKRGEQRIRKSYSELNEAKETLKKLNAELEDKVRERTRELSFSEERFRLVARATNDTLWDWDLASNKIWWSESFAKMFGFSKPDFSRAEWAQHIHPDERAQVEAALYGVINENKNQWNCEYRFRRENGEYAHILDRGYVLHNEFGVPYRMLGSILDLTAQKQAELEVASNIAQRQFLAESMPLMVWTADADGKVDFVNRQFEFYTGIFYDDAMEGGWQQAIWKEDLPMLLDTWQRAATVKADFHCEVRVMVSKKDFRWNLLRAKARKDQKGALISWVITTTDIHEQKVMNEILEEKVEERTRQLLAINRELEASNNDLQLFASVASHDLQEPLRKIHMFSKLVKDRHDGDLPEDTHLYLDKIMQSARRMKALVINILNFSKLSADQAEYTKTDVAQVVKEVMDDFEVIIREKNAVIEVGDIPPLAVNRLQIQQVFQNLISNALKFTTPGEAPKVSITGYRVAQLSFTAPEDPTGRWCRISVKDNGIGFDTEYKNRIFGLFHRLNSKDRFEGTGIGLAITKKIVEKHNGIITAESNEGEGAVFTIILPMDQ
ncbi:PAS domain-containing protein [Chitinophaga horti]|uniref:PAS domain-containing protein n=1 Tax=Chitinophaga horti TaxID=2920382 RepID=A0ABY6J4J6_9BACT|nr:chemotaxis protein CheB [Chitinophaga horti]UYQ94595.1 PAS domain-containing protein [Chitinophaga horti]